MKIKSLVRWTTLLVILGAAGCGCTDPEGSGEEERAEAPAPAESASAAAKSADVAGKSDALATITDLAPRISIRRKQELVWREAAAGDRLYAYDSVRSHVGAKARIVLSNGSVLELKENSLIILTPNVLRSGDNRDRAVIRAGDVTGVTGRELSILTSGALLDIRPKKNGKTANASVTVREGKQLKIVLHAGEGYLTRLTRTDKAEAIPQLEPLKAETPVILAAPLATELFGIEMPADTWERGPVVPRSAKPAQAPRSRTPVPAASPVTVTITSPADYAQVFDAFVEIKGFLSRPGQLVVNGTPTPVDPRNRFSARVSLQKGTNTVVLQAIAPGTAPTYRRITVIRKNK